MVDDKTTIPVVPRLAERLTAARERRFVGRDAELALFRQALEAPEPPFAVLYVSGPGGVGKTTLLDAFARIVDQSGGVQVQIDGRGIEPSPHGFTVALSGALGLAPGASPSEALARDAPVVLLIDAYEQLAPLDRWLREQFLPELPARALVVIAGRNPPDSAWRTDPGWGALFHDLRLRNLRPEESRDYLRARQVPDDQHPSVLAYTYGHPLALSLVADVLALGKERGSVNPVDDPDVVRVLLERFVQSSPSPQRRQALEVCAHVRVTTEALLADALELEDAGDLFAWLRELSFIEHTTQGIAPHDLARDVLDADLRWRNPEEYRRLHRRVRRAIVKAVQQAHGFEQQRAFLDMLFLHRSSPIMRPFYRWSRLGRAYHEPAASADGPAILEMVEHWEGPAVAALARYWLERQPHSFYAFRDSAETLIGFTCILTLDETTEEDRQVDPALAAAQEHMQRYGPLRAGESAIYSRFTCSRSSPLEDDTSGVWELVSSVNVIHWMLTPHLAWNFIGIGNLEHWRTFFHYIRMPHAVEAGFSVGDRDYHVFAHDWRAEPLLDWLDLMAERELALDVTPELVEPAPRTPLVVLSQPAFEDAVRRALRDFARPDALAANPLMRSRLIADAVDGAPSAEALRSVLRLAAEALAAAPRGERLYRAVNRTYLSPAPTQEQAAELLGVPFSTYRYHLTAGIERITAALWQRELYGAEG